MRLARGHLIGTLAGVIADLRGRFSLAGRLLAIVLAVLVIDFATNSYMFERASTFAVNSEEAASMAEHLVVARRMASAVPFERRRDLARQLSTDRFQIEWRLRRDSDRNQIKLVALRDQIIAAEPELARAALRLELQPISQGGKVGGSILLADGSAIVFRSASAVSWSLNAGLLLRFSLPSLLLFGLAWWLVRSSFQPLLALVRATAQVGTDEMVTLPETGQSEVRQLIRGFNRMHHRITQLLDSRTQTLLAIGHDLRTPLARLQLRLDAPGIAPDLRDEMTADIGEMTELLASLQAYVEFGREDAPAERFDLAAMVRSRVDDAEDAGGLVSYHGPDSLPITGHPLGLRRAIANLVQNAVRYGGRADVSLRLFPDSVVVDVADDGPGIPPDRLEDVVQPFIRLDSARTRNTAGMGLGLAIVDRAVRAEGGTLTLTNRAEGGLLARITLPGTVTGALK